MQQIKHGVLSLVFTLGAGYAQHASATLIDLGNGLINDTAQNLTWAQDGALAASNSFGVSDIGPTPPDNMDWHKAQEWIAAMNTANYKGYNDWRLPVCLNASCSDDEMTSLWVNSLGNSSGTPAEAGNWGPFQNVGGPGFHALWLGTEAVGGLEAWTTLFGSGTYTMEKSWAGGQGSWAVRSGLSAVPVPAAAWLFSSALAGFTLFNRRKTTK